MNPTGDVKAEIRHSKESKMIPLFKFTIAGGKVLWIAALNLQAADAVAMRSLEAGTKVDRVEAAGAVLVDPDLLKAE